MSSKVSTFQNDTTTNTTRPSSARRNVVVIDISENEASSPSTEDAPPAATARQNEMVAAFRAAWPAYRSQPESDRVIDAIVTRDDDASLVAAVRAAPEPTEAESPQAELDEAPRG